MILIYAWFIIFGVISFSTFIIWLVWIRSYLKDVGKKPGPLFFGLTPIYDYLTAKRDASEKGNVPWFLTWSKTLYIAGFSLIGLFIIFMVVVTFLKSH